MINALHLIWILPCTMMFGYVVGAVLAADIDAYRDEQRGLNKCDGWPDDADYVDDTDEGTDDYGYERED